MTAEPTGGGRIAFGRSARRILAEEPEVRAAVTRGTLHFDAQRRAAFAGTDAVRWRSWARSVRDHVLRNLADHLESAEARLVRNGAVVHWAERPRDVHEILLRLVDAYGVRSVVKGKSMLSEELGVNALLASRGVDAVETDLGEYVVQLGGEPPSHILAPAIHRGIDDIRRLFAERLGTPPDASAQTLAAAARRVLRERFIAADMGITGANFLVAETGTLALIENEGNIRLTTSLPRVHVALVGIEKLLATLADLASFLQIVSRSATGQPIGTFVSLLHGPRAADEPDGPEALHVVLVDNGRSALLGDARAWEALRCVRCSACLNVCPVYRQTGGHPYGWAYSGPIGAALAPAMLGLDRAAELPAASTLCGACRDVCPVRIPIPSLLVEWRRRAVEAESAPRAEGAMVRAFAAAMRSPARYRAASRLLRMIPQVALRGRLLPVLRAWNGVRGGLRPSPRTFRELWEEGIR